MTATIAFIALGLTALAINGSVACPMVVCLVVVGRLGPGEDGVERLDFKF